MASVVELVLRARADAESLRQVSSQLRSAVENSARQAAEQAGRRVRETFAELQPRFQQAGRELAVSLTAPLTLLGGMAARQFLAFDQVFTRIATLTGVAREEMGRLREAVEALSRETGRAPQELAEGLYFLLSSGLKTAEALQALRASAMAAATGLGETKTIADAVSTAMNAYGASVLDADQATALLIAAVREGKGEATELAGAIGRVVPVAASLGVPFHEVAAALAAMTQVGLSAEEAVTALRAVFLDLLNPSKQAEEVLRKYGLSAEQLRRTLQEGGLLAVLELLRDTFQGNEQELVQVIDNVRGLVGFLNLMGRDAEQVRGVFQRLANTTKDELTAAFAEVRKSVSHQFAQALADLATAAIKLGQTMEPGIRAVAAALSSLARAFGGLPAPVRAAVVVFGAFLAAIGPLFLMLGQLARLVGSLGVVWRALAAALSAPLVRAALDALRSVLGALVGLLPRVGSAVLRLAGPLGIAASAVVAFYKAWHDNWLGIRQAVEKHVPAVAAIINRLVQFADEAAAALRRTGVAPPAAAPQPAPTPPGPPSPPSPPAAAAVDEQRLRAIEETERKILELRGQALQARLAMIEQEKREVLKATGDVLLAERYAYAARLQALREFEQQRVQVILGMWRDLASATADQGMQQLVQLREHLEERANELRQALDAELITWRTYSDAVVALEREGQLTAARALAAALVQRRAELERWVSEYENTIMRIVDIDARIARLRAQIAGERASEVLRAEQTALEGALRSEQLSAEQRVEIARRLESVIEQRIRALEQEKAESWALAAAQADLNRARQAELDALLQVRRQQAEQLPVLRELIATAVEAAQRLRAAWEKFVAGLREGAVSVRDLVMRTLAQEAPRAFISAWQVAVAQVRRELLLLRETMAQLDPRVRRSPSVVDMVRAGMQEVEETVVRSARRIAAAIGDVAHAPGRQAAARGAAGVTFIVNGQQIQLTGRQAVDLVALLVRDPVQRVHLLRAMEAG